MVSVDVKHNVYLLIIIIHLKKNLLIIQCAFKRKSHIHTAFLLYVLTDPLCLTRLSMFITFVSNLETA